MKKIIAICAIAAACLLTASCGDGETSTGLRVNYYVDTVDPNATHIGAPGYDTAENNEVQTLTTPAQSTAQAKPPVSNTNNGETRIKFLAAGDNIIHENVFLDARSRAGAGEKYNFTDMYKDIVDFIARADIALINQETPICGDEMGVSGYPNFNSPEAAGDTLIDLGFDIINLANNHMLDKGERGYRGSLEYWEARAGKVMTIGGYKNKADYENIRIYEEQGVKIAFLTYTYSTNSMYLPTSSELYIPYINESEIVSKIAEAEKLADLVFVVMHWGNDAPHTVSSSQKTLAASLTEAGADVILGMHPHGVQPIEWKTASDGTKTLLVYSLGNLISTQKDNFNLVGGVLTFDIVKSASGSITIENPIYNPTVTHYNTERLGLQVYLMEDYTAELAALHGIKNQGYTADSRIWTMDKIKSFATDKISSEFLPEFLK